MLAKAVLPAVGAGLCFGMAVSGMIYEFETARHPVVTFFAWIAIATLGHWGACCMEKGLDALGE